MKLIRKQDSNFPCYLHDSHIQKIKVKDDKMKIIFDHFYYKDGDNEGKYVNGSITFNGIDYDASNIYAVKYSYKKNKLKGKKYSIKSFLKKNKDLDMEIITETCNGYYTVWTGWVYKNNRHKEDFMMTIWNDGKVVYHVEDET